MNAPWLFAEAYKYRRLHECFSVSKFWGEYDVFYRQKVCPFFLTQMYAFLIRSFIKCDTFSRSSDAVFELSQRFAEPFKLDDSLAPEEKLEAERLMFLELTQGAISPAPFMRTDTHHFQFVSGVIQQIFLSS